MNLTESQILRQYEKLISEDVPVDEAKKAVDTDLLTETKQYIAQLKADISQFEQAMVDANPANLCFIAQSISENARGLEYEFEQRFPKYF